MNGHKLCPEPNGLPKSKKIYSLKSERASMRTESTNIDSL